MVGGHAMTEAKAAGSHASPPGRAPVDEEHEELWDGVVSHFIAVFVEDGTWSSFVLALRPT